MLKLIKSRPLTVETLRHTNGTLWSMVAVKIEWDIKLPKEIPMGNILSILLLITCNVITVFFLKNLCCCFPTFTAKDLLTGLTYKEFYIAILSGCLAVLLYIFTLHRMELSRLMPVLGALLTILTSVVGFVCFGEPITTTKVAGLCAVITGDSAINVLGVC